MSFFKFFFLNLILIADLEVPAQNPYIQNLTTADGLPSNQVYQVYHDSQNFIWFATDAGVARYDGSSFMYLRKRDGLNSNQIVRIKEDSQRRLWLFNLNATLNFYKNGILYNSENAPFLDSLSSKFFFLDFYEDSDSILYFHKGDGNEFYTLGSNNVVKKYKIPAFELPEIYPEQSRQTPGKINHITRDSSGKLNLYTTFWLLITDNLDNEPEKVLWDLYIANVLPSSDSVVYIIADYSLPEKFRLLKYLHHQLVDTLSFPLHYYPVNISAFLEEAGGYLWVSTYNRGLFYLKDKEIIKQLDIQAAQELTHDHEGNVWTSSLKQGAYKISPGFRAHIHYGRNQFANSGITALTKHREKGVWCTNSKTVFLLQDAEFYHSSFYEADAVFSQLAHLENNNLLIGEPNNYLYTLPNVRTNQKSKQLMHAPALVSNHHIKKIAVNRTNAEVSSFYNTYLLLPESGKTDNLKITNFPHGRMFTTFYNTAGDLCINSSRNYRLVNGRYERYERLSFFDNKIIKGHLVLNDTTELFNIEGDNLYLLTGSEIADLTAGFKPPITMQIRHMAWEHPYLFLATSANVYVCENPLNIFHGKPALPDPIDMEFNTIHSILFYNDTLYIGSDEGLTLIPHASIGEIQAILPIPYFKNIVINDREHPVAEKFIQVRGKHRLQFTFGSISYSGSPLIFSYMVEGLDDEWKTGSESNVVYQNLPKGRYNLKLRVRKPTTTWSEAAGYEIVVHATLLQKPWFYVMSFIFLAGLALIMVLFQKNRLLKRRETEHQLVLLEQKALHSMMNPHFIFNTLGSIQKYLLQNQADEAGLFLSQFARLIRQNISAIKSGMTGLDEEIDRLKNYLELEQLRMQNKFDYRLTVDSDVNEDEIMFPSMILQPIVENAIWHGVSAIEEQGLITISLHLHARNALKVIISDNGPGMKKVPNPEAKDDKRLHLGMELTRKRLAILGKRQHVKTAVEITEANPGSPNPGTQVVLIIPFNYGEIE